MASSETIAQQLTVSLQIANIPIQGVIINNPLDKNTWRIDYLPSATPTDIANGNALLAAFTPANLRFVDCTSIKKQLIATIYASPTNVFMPLGMRFGLTSVVALTTVPTISVGTNSPNYDNLIAATPSPLTVLQDMINVLLASPTKTKYLTAFLGVYMNVRVAAVASAYTLAAMPLGDYLNLS